MPLISTSIFYIDESNTQQPVCLSLQNIINYGLIHLKKRIYCFDRVEAANFT